MNNKTIIIFILCSIIFSNPNSKKDCVVCHITWSDTKSHDFLKKENSHHLIDGVLSFVSTTEMCYSCHDGYVADSRKYFIKNDNHLQNDIEHTHLPLNSQNKLYCGTCHTPHNSEMFETVNYSPFLREKVNDSQLCISCHNDNITTHINHPIHVKQNNFPKALIRDDIVDNVECLTCHNLHDHQTTKLTIENNSSSLCYECHSTQFSIELSDHDFRYLGNGNSTNDVCSGCHLAHKGKDKLMWANELTENNNNRFCVNCHTENGIGKEKILTNHGHPVDTKIIKECSDKNLSENDTEIKCTSCHNPHEWSLTHVELSKNNEEGNSITSFLKRPDDSNGSLCISCHQTESEITLSDHSTNRAGFQNINLDENYNQGQCTICHNTHSDDYQFSKEINEVSKTTTLCLACHQDNENITSIGKHSHPIGVNFKTHEILPGVEKDNMNLLGCETCHDPHKWGVELYQNNGHNLDGDATSSFLKIPSTPNSELCASCHENEMNLVGSKHDMTTILNSKFNNACEGCHDMHNAETQYGLLDSLANHHNTFGEQHCLTCHAEKGIANESIPSALTHPINNKVLNDLSPFSYKDLKDKKKHNEIDCLTCHNSHQWSFDMLLNDINSFKENGTAKTSFLKKPSYNTQCQECHQKDGLWKYLYFHDTNKRNQF